MSWVDVAGYLGAAFTVATFSMKTMLRLRIAGLAANAAFIVYGLLGQVYPVLFLHLVLLPLNLLRLRELLRIVQGMRKASAGGFSVEWIRPFARYRRLAAGELLFHRGDHAEAAMFVLNGRLRAQEAGTTMGPGDVLGELGLITQDHRRTQSVVCETEAELLVVGYEELRTLYFQNPAFGFFFLELAARRLLRDAGHAVGAPTAAS
jgi:CRP/FNR family cyclic AMP-dependent transcriptional regulator